MYIYCVDYLRFIKKLISFAEKQFSYLGKKKIAGVRKKLLTQFFFCGRGCNFR